MHFVCIALMVENNILAQFNSFLAMRKIIMQKVKYFILNAVTIEPMQIINPW